MKLHQCLTYGLPSEKRKLSEFSDDVIDAAPGSYRQVQTECDHVAEVSYSQVSSKCSYVSRDLFNKANFKYTGREMGA